MLFLFSSLETGKSALYNSISFPNLLQRVALCPECRTSRYHRLRYSHWNGCSYMARLSRSPAKKNRSALYPKEKTIWSSSLASSYKHEHHSESGFLFWGLSPLTIERAQACSRNRSRLSSFKWGRSVLKELFNCWLAKMSAKRKVIFLTLRVQNVPMLALYRNSRMLLGVAAQM